MDAITWYMNRGLIIRARGMKELAAAVGAQPEDLSAELTAYRHAAAKGVDDFGKTSFPSPFSAENLEAKDSFAMLVTPALHYCMGGLKTDTEARVLRAEADAGPVPGLFAAGEVIGGVHGSNRLAGNSLLDCVVFGRTAGQGAATWATAQPIRAAG